VVFYLYAFLNNLVFPNAKLMCQRMLKHHFYLILFLLLKFSCSMSCTVVVYTPEGFMLAYFMAKKGEKNGISIPSICLHLFCSFMYVMPVMPVLLLHLF